MPNLLRPILLVAVLLGATPAAAQDSTVVFLVRHAEKSSDPDAADPPLTAAGEARAAALREALEGTPVHAVIATQRERTQATARPLAQARGIVPEIVSLGDAHADSVAAAVRRHAGHTVLVVGHSNTVARIIRALGGLSLRDLCDPEHANLFVLVIRDGAEPRLERRTYGAPDPPDAAACRTEP